LRILHAVIAEQRRVRSSIRSIRLSPSFAAILSVHFFFEMLAQIRRRFYSSSAVTAALKDKYGLVADDVCNVPQGILDKVGRNLHNKQHHPLNMIKKRVVASLQAR